MVIAIDIDDVLYPFADNASRYVHKVSGRHVTNSELFGDQEFTKSGLERKEFSTYVKQYQFDDVSLGHPPLPGALEALSELAIDHDIYLVTSRHPDISEMTKRWLKVHIGDSQIKEIIFVGNHWNGVVTETKADVCRRIRADYLIEDQPRYIELFKDHPTKAILFGEYEWNIDHHKVHPLKAIGWPDVLHIIRNQSTI